MPNLEPLPYAYNSLEPYIDEQTMRIHHDKHHQAYFDKFTAAISGEMKLKDKKVEEILKDLSQISEKVKTAVVNHGGGYYNHSFFWQILKKDVPFSGKVSEAIVKQWGSFDKFKEELSNAAVGKFGSGWAWLVLNKGRLEIITTSNQDCPLSLGMVPLLNIDVWEHAYYLKYQNRRAEYVENFCKVINWKKVDELYNKAVKK